MGFLTILNYIAMGVGYLVLLIVILFSLWLLISTIKDKMQRKKWEREKADKEKVEAMVKEKEETTTTASPVIETQQDQKSTQQNITQSTTTLQTEKKEETAENKENLVDENGKVKMVG